MTRLIVTGGRLDHRADVATALWAFDILRYTDPGLSLVVLGDGPERERLMRFARQAVWDDDISFSPFVFDTVRPAQFEQSVQVWVPHRAGGWRLALAAMAAGRPVVAADTPELRQTLGDAGRFFRPGDRAGLAVQARRLLDRPDQATALGDAGRLRATTHFPDWQLADPLAAAYHDAGRHHPAR